MFRALRGGVGAARFRRYARVESNLVPLPPSVMPTTALAPGGIIAIQAGTYQLSGGTISGGTNTNLSRGAVTCTGVTVGSSLTGIQTS